MLQFDTIKSCNLWAQDISDLLRSIYFSHISQLIVTYVFYAFDLIYFLLSDI